MVHNVPPYIMSKLRAVAYLLALASSGVCIDVAASSDSLNGPMAENDLYPQRKGAAVATFYWENDGAYTDFIAPSDRWYTSGAGLSVQWNSEPTDELISNIPSIGGEFSLRPGVNFAAGTVYSMSIYTPDDIRNPNPIPDDRPYAGWAYGGFFAQRADRGATVPTFEHLELDIGALGSASRAGSAQKWVHETFNEVYPEGWNHQVDNEVGVNFKYVRKWRFDLTDTRDPAEFGAQVIADAGFVLGTVQINASAGAMLRGGWNMPDDFGPGTMQYAGDFTTASDSWAKTIGGYAFVRPGVMLVGHDATFGNSFFNNNEVSRDTIPEVFTGSAGVCLVFLKHWQLSYVQTFTSPEFESQAAWHSYASINLSGSWTW